MRISEKEFRALLAKSPSLASKIGTLPTQAISKYRNQKVYTCTDGYISSGKKDPRHGKPVAVFDSKKEFDRWNELLLMQKSGRISNLQRQYKLIIQEKTEINDKNIKEIAYVADFVYNSKDGKTVVEDVKPFDTKTQKHKTTKDFSIKWKLLKVRYPEYRFELY